MFTMFHHVSPCFTMFYIVLSSFIEISWSIFRFARVRRRFCCWAVWSRHWLQLHHPQRLAMQAMQHGRAHGPRTSSRLRADFEPTSRRLRDFETSSPTLSPGEGEKVTERWLKGGWKVAERWLKLEMTEMSRLVCQTPIWCEGQDSQIYLEWSSLVAFAASQYKKTCRRHITTQQWSHLYNPSRKNRKINSKKILHYFLSFISLPFRRCRRCWRHLKTLKLLAISSSSERQGLDVAGCGDGRCAGLISQQGVLPEVVASLEQSGTFQWCMMVHDGACSNAVHAKRILSETSETFEQSFSSNMFIFSFKFTFLRMGEAPIWTDDEPVYLSLLVVQL